MTAALEQTADQVEPATADTPPAEQTPTEVPAEQPPAAEQTPAEQPGTAVAPRGFLAIDPQQNKLRPDQRASLRAIGIEDDFDLAQIRVFIHFCQARNLDPYAKEAYLIKRKDKYSIQTSIDTYRRKAFETGRYRRKVGVYWTGADNDPQSWVMDPQTRVRYRVWEDVWLRPEHPAAAKCVIEYYDERGDVVTTEAIVNWEMFVGTTWKNGTKVPNDMWTKGGPHQLSKCAEALALRSAFPTALSGMFVQEEMSHLDSEANAEYMQQVVQRRQEAFAKAQAAKVDQGGDTLEGVIVGHGTPPEETTDGAAEAGDGDPAELALLLGELDEQARILGTSRAKLTNRMVAMHRCNPENLPIDAVRSLVLGLRPSVAHAMETRDAKAAAGAYLDLPNHGHPAFKELLEWVAGPSEQAS